MIARLKAWLASVLADIGRLLMRSRTFFLAAVGTVAAAWPAVVDAIPQLQQVVDAAPWLPAWVRPTLAIIGPLGAAVFRLADHRTGANPA